jgi:hypothetical protein
MREAFFAFAPSFCSSSRCAAVNPSWHSILSLARVVLSKALLNLWKQNFYEVVAILSCYCSFAKANLTAEAEKRRHASEAS